MDPKGKIAVVTGGNSGLGRATAEALRNAGANVVSLDLRGKPPEDVEWTMCDVVDAEGVKVDIAAIHGPIHILVNCAGIGGLGPIATADGPGNVDDMEWVIKVNLVGAMNVTAEVAHRMTSNEPSGPDGERGVIVNTCSIASFEGQEGMGAYTAAKSALAALTLVWARDLAKYAIRVNGIAPGFMATPMVAMLPPDFVEELLKGNEFPKRAGTGEDFASAVEFLIRNPLVNGEVLRLDGGARPPARTTWASGG